ncbi:MAG: helix-turn-helix domain-containing protein [Sulfurimonas sp.]
MTQSDLAETLGISRQAISAKLKDKTIRGEYLKRLIRFALIFSKEDFEELEKDMEIRLENEIQIDDSMLDEKEVAELSGYSVNTLRTWRSRNREPEFIRIEGGNGKTAIRYDKEVILKWMEKNKAIK